MDIGIKNFYSSVELTTSNFIEKLRKEENYSYLPVLEGATSAGKDLSLGFSCYALKSYYILNQGHLDESNKIFWAEHINSYQSDDGQFIDPMYVYHMRNIGFQAKSKDLAKNILNIFGKEYVNRKETHINSIRAESKQAISSLYQINNKNSLPYNNFPQNISDLEKYLKNLNWKKPWSAGAQFAAICVFTKTQISDLNHYEEYINFFSEFISKITNEDTGGFYEGNISGSEELINGAMKVITGFEWIDLKLTYPEKLIDYCLNSNPTQEGCNVVDTIYVLWHCSKQTNYKKSEISNFLIGLLDIIKLHHFKSGGFSYYLNKSQIYYYGLQISKGLNTPDLHGTVLFLWALSMINDVCEFGRDWKTLKA